MAAEPDGGALLGGSRNTPLYGCRHISQNLLPCGKQEGSRCFVCMLMAEAEQAAIERSLGEHTSENVKAQRCMHR